MRASGVRRSPVRLFALTLLVGLLIVGLVAVPLAGLSTHTAARAAAVHASSPTLAHGDLTIGSGQKVLITPATTGSSTYYQGGNITVLPGGNLTVQYMTLEFAQFVSNSGTVAQRLSHVYHFLVEGQVWIRHSNITTDPALLNDYAKLNLTVAPPGSLNVGAGSSLAFPGWVNVAGAGASLFLNSSLVTDNPLITRGNPPVNESGTLLGDIAWAPSISISNGARMFAGQSQLSFTYADNWLRNGRPNATVQNLTPLTVGAAAETWAGFPLAVPSGYTLAEALVQATLYPSYSAAQVAFAYDSSTGAANAPVTVTYGTTSASTTVDFGTTTGGVAVVAIPAAVVNAINAGGLVNFLQSSGSFGPSALPKLTISVGPIAGTVDVHSVAASMFGSAQFDLTVSAGSTLSAADSALAINFETSGGATPWASNKVALTGGSAAYLANVTFGTGPLDLFLNQSAVSVDASSWANFYQWMTVPIVAGPSKTPLYGGIIAPAYSGSDPIAAATVSAQNNLSAVAPDLGRYVTTWDGLHGVPGPGISDSHGRASMLLLSTVLTQVGLPDGQFLGTYNVTVTVPSGSPGDRTITSVSLTPYPQVTLPGRPMLSALIYFADYYSQLQILTVTTAVNSVPSSSVALNQTLTVTVTVKNVGTAPTNNITATLTFSAPLEPILVASATTSTPLAGGATAQLVLNWLVVYTVTGVLSGPTQATLGISVIWNGGAPAGGTTGTAASITITATPPTTQNILFEKFLFFALWIWLAIAAAIVGGAVGILYMFGALARGRLVECGECGELIPERAVSCPKCGAEFETDMVRCSRCGSTIPATSAVCPECAATLLARAGPESSDPERQAYAYFAERFRSEAKRELGDNYSEGAFWDWWKRQPTYISFSQYRLQQAQGTRAGMTAPPATIQTTTAAPAAVARRPPPGGSGAAPVRSAAPAQAAPRSAPPPASYQGPAAAAGGTKTCPNCGKEINADFLVCPFCGSVTG